MIEQLSLEGLDAPRSSTDRLFFAIFPDAPAVAQITQQGHDFRIEHGLLGQLQAPDRFHVTLDHIGDYYGVPAGIVATATEAAAKINMPPFDVMFDRAASFSGAIGKNPFVLLGSSDDTALHAFRASLVKALRMAGVPSLSTKHFTPHITLLRDTRLVAEHPIEAVRWRVREFVLVHSLLGQTKHIPLARWALRD